MVESEPVDQELQRSGDWNGDQRTDDPEQSCAAQDSHQSGDHRNVPRAPILRTSR